MIPRSLKRFAPSFVMRAYERELHKETHINRALGLFGVATRYVEIGVRDGECIAKINATQKYAIDPAPVAPDRIERDGTQVFSVTSDTFFEEIAGQELTGDSIHVALADGLHEFEQTLRDVLNLEKYMRPEGLIFIHDCNPPTRRHAEDRNGPWNGDVWKVAHYLRQYRPDLEYFTLDCDWGLGVVSGFAKVPASPDSRNIDVVTRLGYDFLDRNRSDLLNLKSPLYSLRYFALRRLSG